MSSYNEIFKFSGSEEGKFRLSGKELTSLIPKSRSPINKRKMKVSLEVVSFIRKLRAEHCRLGKTKIKPFLDAFCEEKNYKKLSVSTHR